MNIKHLFYLVFLAIIASFSACVDQEFDMPTIPGLPDLEATTTIADLKARYPVGPNGTAVQIQEDDILEVVVTADDESGNFYRQIAVQDETGGIIVRLNGNGVFGTYPVGRQVFIRLQGLYVSDFNGLPQLNGSPTDPIEELLVPQILISGERGITVTPEVVTIAELQNPTRLKELLATLIQLEDVQFTNADAGAPYADAILRRTLNRTVEDCAGNDIIVRTSGFADFAAQLTPEGKGTLTAVLSVFGDTRQLLIRDETDAQMNGPRCGGGTGTGDLVPIADIRALFAGGATTAPDNTKIKGVVISDYQAGNITGRNLVLQDGAAGIAIRFADNHSFALGEELEIVISGLELSEFNGLLQINNVPNGNATSQGTGVLPTPRTATVSEIIANLEAWESTLVQIENAMLQGGPTIAEAGTVTDATGSIDIFTRNTSNFANNATPTGAVTITAIVSQFNDAQINVRNANDISGGGMGVDPTLINAAELRSLFEDGATSVPAGRKIRGIVTSDTGNGNLTTRNLVLQDDTGGIVIRFTGDHNFTLGEEIEVVISNMELSEFNGLLQINNVPNANANTFGPGTQPTPQLVTVSQILNNLEDYESELVRLENVTLSGGTTYAGSITVTDATGSIQMFTRTQATFAGAALPTGPVDLVAIVAQFNDPQILIRNLNDVEQ